MELSEEQLKKLSVLFEGKVEKELTIEEVRKFVQLDTIGDCKQYLRVILDFYFDVIKSPEGRKANSYIEDDRNIWMQTMFSKGCQFISLLDGVGYSKGTIRLKPIIDFSILFTIARSVYESLIAFELLFVLPKTDDQQTIIYNLFMAQGLSERLKDLDEEMRSHNPTRVQEEQNDIDDCRKAIEDTELYKLLNVKENLFNSLYSFFSLHGHPSYLSLIQFRDAFKDEYRADKEMAKHATQCILSFMSIFIVDYMKLVPEIKAMYDKLEEPRRFAIGMYEDAMRGEKKFK